MASFNTRVAQQATQNLKILKKLREEAEKVGFKTNLPKTVTEYKKYNKYGSYDYAFELNKELAKFYNRQAKKAKTKSPDEFIKLNYDVIGNNSINTTLKSLNQNLKNINRINNKNYTKDIDNIKLPKQGFKRKANIEYFSNSRTELAKNNLLIALHNYGYKETFNVVKNMKASEIEKIYRSSDEAKDIINIIYKYRILKYNTPDKALARIFKNLDFESDEDYEEEEAY